MTPRFLSSARALAGAVLALLLGAAAARAQYEIKSGSFGTLHRTTVPNEADNTPPILPTQPQFAGVAPTSGGSSTLNADSALATRYVSQVYVVAGTSTPTGTVIVHLRASFGGVFASGAPRYLFGDIIVPPNTDDAGAPLAADSSYWRAQPVQPGENFTHPAGPQDASPKIAAGTALNYYYSPHAEKVFASQAGRVAITWVTRVPVASGSDTTLRYRFREETFAVSSTTQRPTRTIFWTERGFNGPLVNIPLGNIETVNPVYNALFPATVAEEYKPVGVSTSTEPNATAPAEKRTLWFEKPSGLGQLRAYNLEGRILVEYLGRLKAGSSTVHTFLGADIVEIQRIAPTVNAEVAVGEKIVPRDAAGARLPANPNLEWLASPVESLIPEGQAYYGTNTRPDGVTEYFAERENSSPDRVVFFWLERSDAAIAGTSAAPINLYWPKARNAYAIVWPTALNAYAHHTVPPGGTTTANGLMFPSGQLPQVVFQDDGAQSEAVLDASTQRLTLGLVAGGDGVNRSLLRFSTGSEVWYVRLYTQIDARPGFVESDGAAPLLASATVGSRIERPSADYAVAGHIVSGTDLSDAYVVDAYRNPLAVGVEEAASGAIIPVNALPGKNTLKVWWFKAVTPPSAAFQPFYTAAKVGRYTVSYPAAAPEIVLASNAGSGDLSPAEIAGRLYVQNDRTLPGFNPNEEHALVLNGRIYALRDDLNDTSADPTRYTSQPFALLRYTAVADNRPAMSVFRIVRETATVKFDYPLVAGTPVQPPMPLAILPQPVDSRGVTRNTEIAGTPDTAHQGPAHYTAFTFADRKGQHWVYRGPHDNGSPSFRMQFYYTMRDGFFVPGLATQPAVGTILPYLRPIADNAYVGDPVTGTSLAVTYRPVWPDNAPQLRVAETLTLPKFGLPDVISQSSAVVLYQQSIATRGATNPSVVLHDPIREKTFALGGAGQLAALPTSVLTTSSGGKTYFQRLAPHLQLRFYFDPSRGPKGTLVLLGKFVDEAAGEDYVQLNVLSAADLAALRALPGAADAARPQWLEAIDQLVARVETFVEDPAKAGSFKSDGAPVSVGPVALAAIQNSDTAVVDYALTATGKGSGWVTLVFGNGRAFTPAGEPVAVKVFQVTPQLYTGDLKVLPSLNPLDEQVTLRHSGDFAARPEDYEFEWRYAPPQDGRAPATYSYAMTNRLGTTWSQVAAPAAALPSAAEYAAATTVTLPRSAAIRPAGSATIGVTLPGFVYRAPGGLDLSAGVPAEIVFSADVADLTGFVLYVNGVAALAHQAPAGFTSTAAATGLLASGALPKQFRLEPNFFQQGPNRIEIALYTTADAGVASGFDFRLHASTETDLVAVVGSPWQLPNGTLTNEATVGGSASSPLSTPLLVLSDNYFTLRYRPKASTASVAGTAWSRWLPPKLVEGWVKRVLAGINPFNQRVGDLYNNAVNTDVSVLTQAGKRWEGDIALTLKNINSFGLIEIYETVLNRARALSIEAGYDYGAANDALLLAAGYLNDLYTLLGHEAYADAANPTISFDESNAATEVPTARFSFEGQVANVIEEELALLRGRDDFLAPGVTVSPAYNRLYWNYTRGIAAGEALYAVNYNVREKAGAPTADGKLDAADAQYMFPQGHGDAYGHYLTALKGYYGLLTHPNFSWTPRAEAVTVLGQAVTVDYYDERKFAEAAANLSRTAQQVLALTQRQVFKEDPAAGWSHLRDGKVNSSTGAVRQWGVDEWASRAAQGSYYHWVAGNALLPDKDNNPQHTGVQIIDRTTVVALQELPAAGESFQNTIDNANAHLNPLGLAAGAIAFDISATELRGGKSHFEQIYDRSLRAVLNAKGAFDQAARMTRALRNQENKLAVDNAAIVDQERAFVKRLIDLYGTPYSASIGAGRTYDQGYAGPDLQEWFIIERPGGREAAFIDSTAALTVTVPTRVNIRTFTSLHMEDIQRAYDGESAIRTFTFEPSRYAQFSDVWLGGASMGTRAVVGSLQQALAEVEQARIAVAGSRARLAAKQENFKQKHALFLELVETRLARLDAQADARTTTKNLKLAQSALKGLGDYLKSKAETVSDVAPAAAETPPKVVGMSNDGTSGVRGGILATLKTKAGIMRLLSTAATNAAGSLDTQIALVQRNLEFRIEELGFNYQESQASYEFGLMYQELMQHYYELAQVAANLQRATERARAEIAEGQRIQSEREIFRQRAAALIQGFRTKDVTFRTFRNEALEQYRSLFDLASRYTYLAAKSYDYETGLLGSATGQDAINKIVASRALGDLTGGAPQATVSTTGDSGLAGTMARLQADWSVAKGRLGINNPDTNGTLFSLRRELFRLLDDPSRTDDDAAWQQTLEQHIVSDLLADPDIAAQCRGLAKPEGGAVPGIVIPFRTTIERGLNFFGLPYAPGDHAFTPSNYATKIYALGVVFSGYLGMDPFSPGTVFAGPPNTTSPNALGASPHAYLIPVGTDYMLAPPLGDTGQVRAFNVRDQALPLPFNLGATAFSTTQFYNANGTLSEQPWILRKHQAFRAVSDPNLFYSSVPAEFTSSRLVGRSAWNGGWKLVIPAYTLLQNEQEGLNRFAASVKDIQLFLRTYSHSGN